MKRITAAALAVLMVVSLSACIRRNGKGRGMERPQPIQVVVAAQL